ncbi:unnamed protein product, partial [Musa acuminata subsp. burmannicoides]
MGIRAVDLSLLPRRGDSWSQRTESTAAVHTPKQDNSAATRCNRDLLAHTLNHKHKSLSSNLVHLYVESGLNELIIFRVCIVLKLWVNRSDDTVTIVPVLFIENVSVSLRRGRGVSTAMFD